MKDLDKKIAALNALLILGYSQSTLPINLSDALDVAQVMLQELEAVKIMRESIDKI